LPPESHFARMIDTDLLTQRQIDLIAGKSTMLVEGIAGSGKSTALLLRYLRLLREGVPSYNILYLTSEQEQAAQIRKLVSQVAGLPHSELQIETPARFAQRSVELFWPLIARSAGFKEPTRPPNFVDYSVAQSIMWRIVEPMRENAAFEGLRLRNQQIVSQLLDTLNRSALNGLSVQDAFSRLRGAWIGGEQQQRKLDDAQAAVERFQSLCLERNVLDLSATMRLFTTHLDGSDQFNRYTRERYRHLLVDNLEEQTPTTHKYVERMLEWVESAALVADRNGGFKRFLSASPAGVAGFKSACRESVELSDSEAIVANRDLISLANCASDAIHFLSARRPYDGQAVLEVNYASFRNEMAANVADHIAQAASAGIPASSYAVVTPYLDPAMLHAVEREFASRGLKSRVLHRRIPPRDDPRVRTMLTWLRLLWPGLTGPPSHFEVAQALSNSIDGLDPVRAGIIAQFQYNSQSGELSGGESLAEKHRRRLSEEQLAQVDIVAGMLASQPDQEGPVDTLLHYIFTNLINNRSLRSEPDLDDAATYHWLIRAARNLGRSRLALGVYDEAELTRTFVAAILNGLVWPRNAPAAPEQPGEAVVISTVHAFLLSNMSTRRQVWLDISAHGWSNIPRQPLSNAFVLTSDWPAGQSWTAEADQQTRRELLAGAVFGLAARCSEGVVLAGSKVDRRGSIQEGALYKALLSFLPELQQAAF